MNAAAKLSAFAAALAVVFVVAFFGARALVPDSFVQSWNDRAKDSTHHDAGDSGDSGGPTGSDTHDSHGGD